jgi:hypothetical protein
LRPLVRACRSEGLRISPIGAEWTGKSDASRWDKQMEAE